jgi:hypothetical protein
VTTRRIADSCCEPHLHQQLLCVKGECPEVHGGRVSGQHTAPLKHTITCSATAQQTQHNNTADQSCVDKSKHIKQCDLLLTVAVNSSAASCWELGFC